MNLPLASSAGLKISTVSILPLNSNMECESVQACTLAVQVISEVPSQKPTVSPYHCGTFCTCCLPIRTWRRKLAAIPERNWTFQGDTVSWKMPPCEACDHQRTKPSGEQNDASHCGALSTASW